MFHFQEVHCWSENLQMKLCPQGILAPPAAPDDRTMEVVRCWFRQVLLCLRRRLPQAGTCIWHCGYSHRWCSTRWEDLHIGVGKKITFQLAKHCRCQRDGWLSLCVPAFHNDLWLLDLSMITSIGLTWNGDMKLQTSSS